MFDLNEDAADGDKALFKGVRTSKYRHVYGSAARKDQCYDNINITKNAHDSNFCAVNPKFLAIVTESCGGGSFIVIPLDKVGRVEVHAGRVTGHKGQIYDVKWSPFNDNVIASCSDDTTIKCWYIPDEGLLSRNMNQPICDLREHKRRVSFLEWHPTADNILLSAGFDHLVIVWNTARAEVVRVISCHTDVIHSMSFNRDGSLFATTCKDKKLRIIDPRSGAVVNQGLCHHGTKANKVVYLGDSGRLFTVGFSRYSDRQWAVWSEKDLSVPLTIENIDSSSGVLFPYYDHDTRMVYVAGKGDGNIRYYETTDEAPYCHYLSQFLSGQPQRGLGVMPKRGCDVYKCEILRFYKLHATRAVCEPISMIVPRKSEQFQADIFPNTSAPTPALTAEQWISGETRNPILFNLKTGVGAKTNRPIFIKPLTAPMPNGQPATKDFNAKLEYILQANQIDYRAMATAESNGAVNGEQQQQQQKSNGHQNGHTHSPKKNGHSEGYEEHNGKKKKSTNGQSNSPPHQQQQQQQQQFLSKEGSKSESMLLNNFHEAVSRKNNKFFSAGRRNKLPWVKDDDEDSGEEKSTPMCDIVAVKQLPAATYVTIHSDSDDSLANTTDDSMNEEMNYDGVMMTAEDSGSGSGRHHFGNHHHHHLNDSPTSDNSLTDKTASTSDLIEAHLAAKDPKNERELWSVFQEQRALIHKLRSELKEKSDRIDQLEMLIAAANLE